MTGGAKVSSNSFIPSRNLFNTLYKRFSILHECRNYLAMELLSSPSTTALRMLIQLVSWKVMAMCNQWKTVSQRPSNAQNLWPMYSDIEWERRTTKSELSPSRQIWINASDELMVTSEEMLTGSMGVNRLLPLRNDLPTMDADWFSIV